MYSVLVENYEGSFTEAFEWLEGSDLIKGGYYHNEKAFRKDVLRNDVDWGWIHKENKFNIGRIFGQSSLELFPPRIFLFRDVNIALQFKMRL